jgi:hypothetical protein
VDEAQREDEAQARRPAEHAPVEAISLVVYVGDEKVGAIETLRDIAIPEVSELRFYDARDARAGGGSSTSTARSRSSGVDGVVAEPRGGGAVAGRSGGGCGVRDREASDAGVRAVSRLAMRGSIPRGVRSGATHHEGLGAAVETAGSTGRRTREDGGIVWRCRTRA